MCESLKQREKEAAVDRTKSHGLKLQLARDRADIRRRFRLVWRVQQEAGLPSEVAGSLLTERFGSALGKYLLGLMGTELVSWCAIRRFS